MDIATYAAVAVLPLNVVKIVAHTVGPEVEFVPLVLSYFERSRIHLFRATGPCNDL
jgi:hypothetical protein